MRFGVSRQDFRWSVGLLLGWAIVIAGGRAAPPGVTIGSGRVTAVSQSGQFVIVGPAPSPGVKGQRLAPVGDKPQVPIHPDLLAVTCERVRRAVNLRLGAPDRAGLPVHFELRPAHF